MASDYHDIMRPQVEQFAYLKCPSKIRAALVNAGGPRLSLDVIRYSLAEMPKKVEGSHIGEPTDGDARDFRVTGLVRARPPVVVKPRNRQNLKLFEVAKAAPAEPKPRQSFRYKAPPRTYGGTGYAADVIKDVCKALDVPVEAFRSESRQKFLVAARALVVKLLRDRNPSVYSYPRIAEIVGRGDHSTMINAMQKFEHYCTLFPEIAALYLKMREAGE